MIFKQFNPNQDVVAGRTTRIASGFWPGGLTYAFQSNFVDDFWSLTGSTSPSPSFGTSIYDIRRTMYYVNVYPDQTYYDNSDPYFSIAYGNINGEVGSGSFGTDSASIHAFPTKAIYTQYKNLLLGTMDLDGMFTMTSGSTTVTGSDIWAIDFSAYKMKDRIDEGLLQINFSGSFGQYTFIDDSPYSTQTQAVYQLITGSLDSLPASPTYGGIGLFYPSNGIVILNANLLARKIGISYNSFGTHTYPQGIGTADGPGVSGKWPYNPKVTPDSQFSTTTVVPYAYNHRTLFESMQLCSTGSINVRKSEYVPARHYFVRVFNREFNYSNNPTYVYDGTDGIHAKGVIRNSDFISDPKTYITTVGLYNDNNELVAVGKLSRPAVKSFDSELLIKVRLDF